jgi:hypothetical protein
MSRRYFGIFERIIERMAAGTFFVSAPIVWGAFRSGHAITVQDIATIGAISLVALPFVVLFVIDSRPKPSL